MPVYGTMLVRGGKPSRTCATSRIVKWSTSRSYLMGRLFSSSIRFGGTNESARRIRKVPILAVPAGRKDSWAPDSIHNVDG